MAYFSNGTEGGMYEERYCSRCKNYRTDKKSGAMGCPILDLHFAWNYDQMGNTSEARVKKLALDSLIPERPDGFAGKCTMFLDWDTVERRRRARRDKLNIQELPLAND